MTQAITIQPHFANAETQIRRIQATPKSTPKPFETVTEPRDVECWNCGTFWENTKRTICKCGEYIDA